MSLVFPYRHQGSRVIPMRLATLQKIAELLSVPACRTGRDVEADRIFDGCYIPDRYKGYRLQIIERGNAGYAIRIISADGNPPRQTITFKLPSRAFDEACVIIDRTPCTAQVIEIR